jgi:hypothetical protein
MNLPKEFGEDTKMGIWSVIYIPAVCVLTNSCIQRATLSLYFALCWYCPIKAKCSEGLIYAKTPSLGKGAAACEVAGRGYLRQYLSHKPLPAPSRL